VGLVCILCLVFEICVSGGWALRWHLLGSFTLVACASLLVIVDIHVKGELVGVRFFL